MTKAKITDYSVTAASNTDVQDISLAEGWLPATVNNMFRAFLAHVANAANGVSGWLTLQNTITAGTTQTQAGATAITGPLARVTTCANANDGVKLPTCAAEVMITVMNLGATNLQVWPNTSDTVNGGSADAVDANVIPPDSSRTYLGLDATDWRAVPFNVGVTGAITATTVTTTGAITGTTVALDDGAVATPSITNTGDLNTGIYFPAADTVGVVAGGVEQFRFGSIEGGANPIPGGNKNLLLNGGFTVAQRSSVTGIGGTNYVYYGTDGWTHYGTSSSGRYTASQATAGTTDGPFRYCLQVDVTTADTDVSGNNISAVLQKMEGQNLQHLNWGQATNDYPLALSFWVKSPKSGTHCVAVYLQEGNDSCTTEYTVASANTWQYVTVDFPAPGTSVPAIDNDANASLWLVFPLMATGVYQATADAWQTSTEGYATSNQQNLLDNTGNDFFLANVQLELGSVATDFAHEDYGTTLQKCYRYYERKTYDTITTMIATGVWAYSTVGSFGLYYVPKRAVPTISVSSASHFKIVDRTNTVTPADTLTIGGITEVSANMNPGIAAGLPQYGAYMTSNNIGCWIAISAEL